MLAKDTPIGLLGPVTWNIPPKHYGPWEKVVGQLAKGLVTAGYTNITLYATHQAAIDGVKTVGILDKPLGEVPLKGWQARELLHIAHALEHARSNVALVHNHMNYHPLLFSRFLDTVQLVTTLHGSAIEENAHVGYSHYRSLPYVSISDTERDIHPNLNYVATVYNGIDFTEIPFQKEPENYLVHVGRMHPDKGVHHAIALALELGLPIYLAGIVPDDCQTYFQEKIYPFIDDKHVYYLGNLTPPEVYELVSRAKAYIGLIEWDEPFGLSIAEAMAAGTPAVASPRGSHREIVIEGKTGILVQSPEEAVERFGEIEAIDRHICRQTAESLYSLPKMVEGYLAVYERLLAHKKEF